MSPSQRLKPNTQFGPNDLIVPFPLNKLQRASVISSQLLVSSPQFLSAGRVYSLRWQSVVLSWWNTTESCQLQTAEQLLLTNDEGIHLDPRDNFLLGTTFRRVWALEWQTKIHLDCKWTKNWLFLNYYYYFNFNINIRQNFSSLWRPFLTVSEIVFLTPSHKSQLIVYKQKLKMCSFASGKWQKI